MFLFLLDQLHDVLDEIFEAITQQNPLWTQPAGVVVSMSFATVATMMWLFYQQRPSAWRKESPVVDDNNDAAAAADPSFFQPCPNTNCVRCRTYQVVNEKAKERLGKVISLRDDSAAVLYRATVHRVMDAVQRGPRQQRDNNNNNKTVAPVDNQYPNVLLVRGLSVIHPIVTEWHAPACRILESEHETLVREYQQLVVAQQQQLGNKDNDNDFYWLENDVPAGMWRALHLMNQGIWNDAATVHCPETTRLVRSLPNLLHTACVFANVFYSEVYPGTAIEPHCGPTNVRHRLHLTLRTSSHDNNNNKDDAWLHVRDATDQTHSVAWHTGRAWVFDDSMVHSVEIGSSAPQPRIVLIVDLWHPELNTAERQLITQLYSTTTSTTANLLE